MRTLKELLKEINDWQDEIFTEANAVSAATHLLREVRELVFDLKNGNPESAKLELADVFILTAGIAHLEGIDLEAVVARKMEINRSRVWGAPDAEGVVEHVRGTLLEVFGSELTTEQIDMLKEIVEEQEN